MARQEYTKVLPSPSPETRFFWEACKRHELWLPYCRHCQRFFWYPRDFCPRCFQWEVEWRRASGRGKVYTFAIHYRAFDPRWEPDIPYVTAIVELEEGVRLYTVLVDVEPDPAKVHCDMPVEVVFDDVSEEIALPKFRPLDAARGGDQ